MEQLKLRGMRGRGAGRRWRVGLACAALLLAACNSPPLYEQGAREVLAAGGVEQDLILRLTRREPLAADEAERLLAFESVPVHHLVAANPTTPEPLLRELARHPSFEVRTGIAVNESVPLPVLLDLRSPGKYSTVGCMLARNARLPQEILLEMHRRGEASLGCFAYNRRCPRALMEAIIRDGSSTSRIGLARNPGLPPDLYREMRELPDGLVQRSLDANPAFRQPEGEPSEEPPVQGSRSSKK